MKFGEFPLSEAKNAILAHSHRLPERALKKGRRLTPEDIDTLRAAGYKTVVCAKIEDGDILELSPQSGRVTGKVTAGNVYVDGLSVGDIGTVVLRDRRMLSRDGIVMVIIAVNGQTGKVAGRPDVVSRGFVDNRESRDMLEESRDVVAKVLDHSGARPANWGLINARVREVLSNYYYQQTRRRPMILPFMVRV